MKKIKLKRFLLIFLLCIVVRSIDMPDMTLASARHNGTTGIVPIEIHQDAEVDSMQVIRDSLFGELVDEVATYIMSKSPKAPDISATIVRTGIDNGIDICFMMSQTELETNYGVLGAGRTRKSLFGIYNRKYATYDEAIEHYAMTLKKLYLPGKTEQQLLDNYVTKHGGRYAEDPNYEVSLKRIYLHIVRSTDIEDLQKQYECVS